MLPQAANQTNSNIISGNIVIFGLLQKRESFAGSAKKIKYREVKLKVLSLANFRLHYHTIINGSVGTKYHPRLRIYAGV